MINQTILPVLVKAMDNARDGITISDATKPDNPLIYVNEGFLKMTGYRREDVLGKNCRFLQGNAAAQAGVEAIRQAIRNKETTQVELLNFRKNGEPFWNKLSLTPIFDNAGQVIYYIGVQDDITVEKEKKDLEQVVERQRLVTQTTIVAQEKERKHIGAELHDNINQLLATAKLYLNLAADQEESRMAMIENSSQLIDRSIQEIRKLSHTLVGPKDGQWELQEVLQELLQSVQAGAAFTTALHWQNVEESTWPEDKKITLYRIAQEQVSNILKHAEATHVAIAVTQKNGEICMTIADDGVGFNPAQKAKGIGLQNMETRLELVSGKMVLDTSPGNGCQVTVSIIL